MATMLAGVLWLLVAVSCSSGSNEPRVGPTTTIVEPNGQINIDDLEFRFSMTCYAPGAGAVVAVGTGTEPGTGREVRALVQAFLGDTYVGVVIGDDEVVFEPTLEESFELFIQDDVITGGAIRFVRTDNRSAQSEPAGIGEVLVTCTSYLQGAPPGYDG